VGNLTDNVYLTTTISKYLQFVFWNSRKINILQISYTKISKKVCDYHGRSQTWESRFCRHTVNM